MTHEDTQVLSLSDFMGMLGGVADEYSKDTIEFLVPIEGESGKYRVYQCVSVGQEPGFCTSAKLALKTGKTTNTDKE